MDHLGLPFVGDGDEELGEVYHQLVQLLGVRRQHGLQVFLQKLTTKQLP